MANELPRLIVADAAAWETWLAGHHDDPVGLWLTLAKKDTTEPTSSRTTRRSASAGSMVRHGSATSTPRATLYSPAQEVADLGLAVTAVTTQCAHGGELSGVGPTGAVAGPRARWLHGCGRHRNLRLHTHPRVVARLLRHGPVRTSGTTGLG